MEDLRQDKFMLSERFTLECPTFPPIVYLFYINLYFDNTAVAPLYPQLPGYTQIRVDIFIDMRYCIYSWI